MVSPLLVLGVFTLALKPITDPDFFWHLATGKLIVSSRGIPRRDPFSHTVRGKPWVCHEWVAEVVIYAIHSAGGQVALIATFAALITATFTLLYIRCLRRLRQPGWRSSLLLSMTARKFSRRENFLAALGTILAALASMPTWGVRPQMVSMLLASVFLYCLETVDERLKAQGWPPGWLAFMLLLQTLWVNAHGAYPMGMVFTAAYIAAAPLEDRWWKHKWLALIPFLCLSLVVSAFLSPYGVRILTYPLETLASGAMREYIVEWASPDFHELRFQPLALLLLSLMGILAQSGKRVRVVDILLLVGTGYAALSSARHIPFFTLMAAPVLVEAAAATALPGLEAASCLSACGGKQPGSQRASIAVAVILVIAQAAGTGVQLSRVVQLNRTAQEANYPVKALAFIEAEGIEGKILNTYHWGGYLIWRGYPVFIDGRADVYGDRFLEDYAALYRGKADWREMVGRYPVDYALLEPDAPLSNLLRQSASWELVYEDEVAVVFILLPETAGFSHPMVWDVGLLATVPGKPTAFSHQ